MNINKTAGKLAGVLLGGAVLAGIGAGTALNLVRRRLRPTSRAMITS